MDKYRKDFPILNQHTYLNTAASGIVFDSLLEHRQEHDLDFLIGGSIFREDRNNYLLETRRSIAQFFNHKHEEVVLVPNFSIGFNTIVNGLDKEKKIMLLDEDYPSINHAVITNGFPHSFVTINANLETNIIEQIQTEKPDIFAFSIVQYSSGISLSNTFLQELKLQFPDLLIIADGTQCCGVRKIDFATSGIDILGCSGYKWLLGGYGNGFFMFKENVLEQITPSLYKKNVKTSKYDPSYTNLQARFESGHLDTFNFSSLTHSLKYLKTIGIENIENHTQNLSILLKERLAELELLDHHVLARSSTSTIFNMKADNELYKKLKEEKILTSMRGKGIRISLHFFNNQEDIDKLVMLLNRYR